jgi:hypothetical protein
LVRVKYVMLLAVAASEVTSYTAVWSAAFVGVAVGVELLEAGVVLAGALAAPAPLEQPTSVSNAAAATATMAIRARI